MVEVNVDNNFNLSVSDVLVEELEEMGERDSMNNFNGIKICFWNVHGLINKLQVATAFFEFLNTLDVFCLVETWVKSDFDLFCFVNRLSNFDLDWTFAKQSGGRGRAMGGILIGRKKNLKAFWTFDKFNDIAFLRHVSTGVLIVPAYFPPFSWDTAYNEYNEFMTNFDFHNVLFLGDCNARIGRLTGCVSVDGDLMLRCSKDLVENTRGGKIIDFCTENDLCILNGSGFNDKNGDFTFYNANGHSVIDLALVTRDILNLVLDFEIFYRLESDHFPLLLTFNDKNIKISDSNLLPLIPRLNWKIQDPDEYNLQLERRFLEVNWEEISANEAIGTIINIISQSASKKDFVNFYEQKWFDRECLQARKLFHRAMGKFRRCSSDENHFELCTQRRKFFKLCKQKKVVYRDLILAHFDTISEPGDYWAAVKQYTKKDNCVSDSITPQQWYSYFKQLLNPISDLNKFSMEFDFRENLELDANFNFCELKSAVVKLKVNKAPGVDAVPTEFFKGMSDDNLRVILTQINRVYEGDSFPDNFTQAIVFPLFKRGDLAVISNFRGISFLTSFYKLYTQLLLHRIQLFVFRNSILCENQAGFRKGYSTFDNIFVLDGMIEDQLSYPKGKLFAFFIDFSAAFDTVNREALFFKLDKSGFSTKIIDAIRNIYTITSAKVWTKKGYTDSFFTNCGVRQGCTLSPILFALFINDLADYINIGGFCYEGVQINMLMYADDIVFVASEPEILQEMIDKLADYCKNWDLRVNLAKSQIMVFRKMGKLKNAYKWSYMGRDIEVVSSYKYLGVHFYSTGKFGHHLGSQLSVAKAGLTSVYKNIFYIQATNIDSYFKLFDATARAVMCYAAQVWGYMQYEEVEKLQRFFIKKLFRLPYNTPNYMLLLETGRGSMFLYTLKLHWSFILHTLKLPENRFSKVMLQHGILKDYKWYIMLRKCAIEFGNWNEVVPFTYDLLKVELEKLLVYKIEKDHFDLLNQVLLGQLHPIYKEIKMNWGREEYFSIGLKLRELRHIFMARTEMLPLNWKPWFVDGDYRCSLCNLKADENVEHFILFCPVLKEFRLREFGNVNIALNYSVNDVLKGYIGWKALADYTFRALAYRQELIEEFNFN